MQEPARGEWGKGEAARDGWEQGDVSGACEQCHGHPCPALGVACSTPSTALGEGTAPPCEQVQRRGPAVWDRPPPAAGELSPQSPGSGLNAATPLHILEGLASLIYSFILSSEPHGLLTKHLFVYSVGNCEGLLPACTG